MSRPSGIGPVDPGLQPERTTLAWTRTMIAFCAVALLVIRLADRLGAAAALVVVVIVLVVAAGLVVTAQRRYGASSSSVRAETGVAATIPVIAAAVSTCVIGILASIAVLEE